MKQPYNLCWSRLLLPTLALCSLPTSVFAGGLCDNLTQAECKSIASRQVYALLGSNVIATVYGSKILKQSVVNGVDGNLIGLDFRPSQSSPPDRNNTPGLYALSDTGKIYTVNVNVSGENRATLVSSLTMRFDGGMQTLADFNPVVDALRVIGSNDQNFAVVNSGGNLNATAKQTAITYAAGDPQAGQDPNLTAGTYNNNIAGAATTIFYALDYATESLVTIADLTNGSSATGGGRLKTIGRIVDGAGKPINIAPEAGIDVYTDTVVGNAAIIANGRTMYFLNLGTVNINLPIGSTQNVVAKELAGNPAALIQFQPTPGLITDIAATPSPVFANAADLTVSQSINLAGFTNGQPRTFEITVTNQGPDAQVATQLNATAFPFKDPVISTSQGSCTLAALTEFGRTFSCNLGSLANNGSATVKITVTRLADANVRDSQVTAQFFAQDPAGFFPLHPNDPDGTNNSLTATVFINR